MTDLSHLEDSLKAIERISIQTSQGSFVKMEDLRKLLEGKQEQDVEEKIAAINRGRIRNFAEAKAAARRDPKLQESFAGRPPQIGKSIAAGPDPSSRT